MTDKRWKYVPEEPTIEMMQAGVLAWRRKCESQVYAEPLAGACYQAMLAAPSTPALSGEAEEVVKELRAAHEYWRNRDYLEGSGVLFDTAASLIERQARDLASFLEAAHACDEVDAENTRLRAENTALKARGKVLENANLSTALSLGEAACLIACALEPISANWKKWETAAATIHAVREGIEVQNPNGKCQTLAQV